MDPEDQSRAEARLVGLLETLWSLPLPTVRTLGGGMNSRTWLVRAGCASYVAKQVEPAGVEDLVRGAQAASRLAAAGLVTGPPVPTRDGRLVATEHGLTLLHHVAGVELDGDTDEDQTLMARTLASVHRAGDPTVDPSPPHFLADWLTPSLPGLADHAWLRRALASVRAETDPMVVTSSLVHTDPAPSAFRHDPASGVTGLVDWAGARRGPVLYDVASAVMYLGGLEQARTFLATYGDLGPLGSDELARLDTYRRFRWVVQGAYFASRIAAHDLTGGIEPADNQRGLDAARRGLAGLGLDVD